MKRLIWISLLLPAGLPLVPAPAQTNTAGTIAPPHVMISISGQYQDLAKLYYQGPERPRQPRAAVALNFMGLDCLPCRAELPLFMEVVRSSIKQNEPSGRRVRFFLVSTDSLGRKEELRHFLLANGVNPETEALLDPYGKAREKFGVKAIPRTLVISPQGRITADIEGAVAGYKELLANGIAEALKDERAK